MKVLNKIPGVASQYYATEQFKSSLYPMSDRILDEIKNKMLPGITVCLFSGGHRLPFNATYIEPKMFSHTDISWQPQTLFADPSKPELLFYVLKSLAPANLLILNTAIFIQYREWQQIADDLTNYKNYATQVIASLPIERFDFNRLKYSATEIATLLQGTLIDNTVIVCR